MMHQLLRDKILTTRRERPMLNPRWELYAQIHRTSWNRFQELYDWCDGGVREQVFCLLNGIDEPPGCCRCTNFVIFNIHKNRYNSYCSRQCIHSTAGGLNISAASAILV